VRGVYRNSTLFFGGMAIILGIGIVVRTLVDGGGIGIVLGVLFVALGIGRIYLLRRR